MWRGYVVKPACGRESATRPLECADPEELAEKEEAAAAQFRPVESLSGICPGCRFEREGMQ